MTKRLPIILVAFLGVVFISGGAAADSSQPPQLIDVVDVAAGPMGAAVNPADHLIYVATTTPSPSSTASLTKSSRPSL
jgi:hypothetical protein